MIGSGLERILGERIIEAPEQHQVLGRMFVRTAINGDVTPSVANIEKVRLPTGAAYTITDFDDGQDGQSIDVLGDGTTIIANNANIKTNTGANKLTAGTKFYRFTRFAGIWYEQEGGSSGGGGGGTFETGTTFNPHTPPAVPNAADDEFTGGAVDTAGTRFAGATPWTLRQSGASLTASIDEAGLKIQNDDTLATSRVRGVTQPFPAAGTPKYRCCIEWRGAAINFHSALFFVERGTGAARRMVSIELGTSNRVLQMNQHSTDSDTGGTATNIATFNLPHSRQLWFWEFEYDGANLITRVSVIGAHYEQVNTQTGASYLGGRPDFIGLGAVNASNTTASIAYFRWFRRVA